MTTRQRLERYARFGTGGLTNTAVTYVAFLAANRIVFYQLAYFIAYALGIVFSYIYNTKAVFRVHFSTLGLVAWPLVYAVPYAAGALLLGLLVERAKLPENLAPLVVAAIVAPVTYGINRFLLISTDPVRDRRNG